MRKLILLILCTCISISVFCQSEPSKREMYDELVNTSAYDELIFHIQQQNPIDVVDKVYLIKAYLYNKEKQQLNAYISRLTEEEIVEISDYSPFVIYQSYAELEQWDKVLAFTTQYSSQIYENDLDKFHFDRAYYLFQKGDKQLANQLLDSISNPEYTDKIEYIRSQIWHEQHNFVAFGYYQTDFIDNKQSPVRISQVSVGTTIWSTPFNFSYYKSLMPEDHQQVTVEAYPKINENSYFMVQAGTNITGNLLPQFQSAVHYYLEQKYFEYRFAYRFLQFPGQQIQIPSARLGFHAGLGTLYAEQSGIVVDGDWYANSVFGLRLNFEASESLIDWNIQYGKSPLFIQTIQEFEGLNAFRIYGKGQFRIRKHIFLTPSVLYEVELNDSRYYKRMNYFLQLKYRF